MMARLIERLPAEHAPTKRGRRVPPTESVRACRLVEVLLVGALLTQAGCGDAPSPQPAQPPDLRLGGTSSSISAAEREGIQRFWRVFRQATAKRIGGDYAGALALFDSALTLQPEHLDALYYSGNAAFELGHFTEAERRWRLELKANAHSARAHAQIGMLYSAGLPEAPIDLVVAQRELEAAHSLNRAETGPLVRLGEIALLRGDRDAAAHWLAAASTTNARSVAAVYLRGYLAWTEGDIDAAQHLLLTARHLAGGGPEEVSASAEGQTKAGNRPLLESGNTSPLTAYWRRLADGPASAETQATAAAEYAEFNDTLERIRARIGGRAAEDE